MGDNNYRYLVERPAGFKDDGTPLFYVEISGDSSWTKPTKSSTGGALVDGSLANESNNGKIYNWNEKTSSWKLKADFGV